MSTLSASLDEREENLDGWAAGAELDPLGPVLPPEGVRAVRIADVAARVATLASGRLDVTGVRGAGGAALVASVARTRRVVVVTSDVDAARRFGDDVRFFLGDAKDGVLVFATNDTSPYADVNPDRRSAMARMSVLARLAGDEPWSVLVGSLSALVGVAALGAFGGRALLRALPVAVLRRAGGLVLAGFAGYSIYSLVR